MKHIYFIVLRSFKIFGAYIKGINFILSQILFKMVALRQLMSVTA